MIGPGFSKLRASALHRARLQRYHDILVGNRLVSLEEAQKRFGLKHEEAGAWRSAARRMECTWQHILNAPQGHAKNGDWIGIYANEQSLSPSRVI
jgi:hypothetical protein